MLFSIIQLTVKDPANVAQVGELLAEAGRLSRQEPGCTRFDVYQGRETPTRFTLVEHWESHEALDVHRTAKAYTTIYRTQVLPLVEREAFPSQMLT